MSQIGLSGDSYNLSGVVAEVCIGFGIQLLPLAGKKLVYFVGRMRTYSSTIQGYLADIDKRSSNSGRRQQIADLYYRSVGLYRSGQLETARDGFVTVLKSGLIPQAMGTMIRGYIADIDKRLVERMK